MKQETFVDLVKITVKAGKGGDGLVHFLREKYKPFGGPDGGDGGDGGSVYAVGDRSLKTLLDFKYKRIYEAEDGKNGGPNNRTGKRGKDLFIKVPLGSVFYDDETGEYLGEIVEHGQTLLLARGGKGGRGNTRFATPTNRAPRIAEKGTEGERRTIRIELKLLADIGIVGLPNSGKTTLLNSLVGTEARTGDYPFTTLTPNLGVYNEDSGLRFVLVDIPGIIKDAHKGKGLGLSFLRHIERTRVLLILLDASQGDLEEQYNTILDELRSYKSELLQKPRIIAVNKIDLLHHPPSLNVNEEVYYISALKKIGLEGLKRGIEKCIRKIKTEDS
uniref:GTPase Obg n=1 Tax=candidate division WOR-3 bacterium TaxID=2052148 RepID=A0A7C2K3A0_UNCW3